MLCVRWKSCILISGLCQGFGLFARRRSFSATGAPRLAPRLRRIRGAPGHRAGRQSQLLATLQREPPPSLPPPSPGVTPGRQRLGLSSMSRVSAAWSACREQVPGIAREQVPGITAAVASASTLTSIVPWPRWAPTEGRQGFRSSVVPAGLLWCVTEWCRVLVPARADLKATSPVLFSSPTRFDVASMTKFYVCQRLCGFSIKGYPHSRKKEPLI